MEQAVIDAARPKSHAREAAALQLALHREGRRQHALGRGVEAAQVMVAPVQRDGQARGQIFGKAGVIARRERQAATQAVAARGEPDGAFGRNMDAIGALALDAPADFGGAGEGEADSGIGRQRRGGEALRRDEAQLGAKRAHRFGDALIGEDDAVGLAPGVGRDNDFHPARFVSAPKLSGSGAGASASRAQRSGTSWPSSRSITSEQDSTKSPILT